MASNQIELRVSADRNMLLIIRMTTAGVMSRAGLTLDEMDDMKMAIDEACNLMMLQKPSCESLYLRYEYDEEAVHVFIEGCGISIGTGEAADKNMQEVIGCILESMADEVTMTTRTDGGIQAICLKKNVPDRRRPAV